MQQQNFAVLGRFAPSPSGRMHLGNVFSMLMAWLSVRSAGGSIVLRIEDLDTLRCTPEWSQLLKEDLRWLGLDWDLESQPQHERGPVYEAVLEDLHKRDLVYPCWCTRGLLHAASAPHASDGHWIYPGTCRNLTAAQRSARSASPSWRLKVPNQSICFIDGVYGRKSENLALDCGDFVVKKADGTFAYQLAVVVDDLACGVTQVVRGRDLLGSTARQIYLYRLLGGTPPAYYHVPMLLGENGRRLSKRDRDLDLGVLRRLLSPEQLLGRLAWLAGLTDLPQPVSARELAQDFCWSRIRREDISFRPELFLAV